MSSIKLTADSGGGTVELKAPATTTSDAAITFKLPIADGTNGQALTTNASGQLAFSSVSAGGASNIAFNSGNGIDFSATSDASGMSSELLDDYEEGTWTPVLARSSGATQSTYLTQTGTYTKIGRVVHATVNLYTNSGIGGSSFYLIQGFPYQIDNSSNGNACVFRFSRLYLGNGDYAGGVSAHTFETISGTSTCRLRNTDNNSSPTTISGNTFLFIGSITYFAAT